MNHYKVEICGVDTSKLKVISSAKKKELLLKVKEGDMAARDELIKGNMKLVLSVVQRFTGRKEELDDLFQIGCIGLMKAIDNFDVTQNVQLSTYAVPIVVERGENDIVSLLSSKSAIVSALLDVFFFHKITF